MTDFELSRGNGYHKMPAGQSIMTSTKSLSKRLIGAYIFDWIAIALIAAIAGGISTVSPHYRAFSVLDLSISFPLVPETISTGLLAVVAAIIPAIIIFLVVAILVPGPATWRTMSKTTIVQWKLWEWNVGWLGLALTHATSQLLVQGMKNLGGKPRPDMLARCQPNLDALADHRVGGYGQNFTPGWILVDQTICTQTDSAILDDGFRSWPSGHAATSWAGMLFLSLWLASKFNIWFPTLPLTGARGDAYGLNAKESRQVVYRDEGAAPPTWLLFLIYIPLGVAIYITSTRFFEYYHFGFDILSGAVIGIISAWFSFRWYNLPLGRSAGWAWGPRSRGRAFGVGVGKRGWVSDNKTPVARLGRPEDIEMGGRVLSPYDSQPQSHDTNAINDMASAARWNGGQQQYQELRSPGPYVKPTALSMVDQR